MKKHELGFELFESSNGELSNEEIASTCNVSESTVRKWKSRYKWLEKMENVECDKNVTTSECDNEDNEREKQRKRVIDALVEAGTYSPAYEILIELYLDAYMEYVESRKEGIGDEKLRKEVARLLNQLGLDGKNKELVKKSGMLLARGDEENKKKEVVETPAEVSRLDDFRNRRKRG